MFTTLDKTLNKKKEEIGEVYGLKHNTVHDIVQNAESGKIHKIKNEYYKEKKERRGRRQCCC